MIPKSLSASNSSAVSAQQDSAVSSTFGDINLGGSKWTPWIVGGFVIVFFVALVFSGRKRS